MKELLSFGLFFIGLILLFISINDLSIITLISVFSIISGLIALSRSA
tara:strand:- start:3919 stop:4059 length:141 start_codon:yes stop_codon:yes gene_type:complete